MPEGGTRTDLTGVVARITQAARFVINGVTPATWMGPMQPMQPVVPDVTEGRRFDYPVGYNLSDQPRALSRTSFADLRGLAEGCDILRAVIETRKDQIEALDWAIRLSEASRDKRIKPSADQKKRIDAATTFLHRPDGVHDFAYWLREIVEDVLVIDGAAIYKQRARSGKLAALKVYDAATIRLLIDANGFTPTAPSPAYQQFIKGLPYDDFTTEELIYLKRNPRSSKIYGYGPVEQVLVTVNTAIRRAISQLEYYTDGSQPDAFLGLPAEWTQPQIRDFQGYFDALFSGNTAQRRKLKFIPDGGKYIEAKAPALKDVYDEWLARIICFVFSISPEPFVQHQNRATAGTSKGRGDEEGRGPLKRFVKRFIDQIVRQEFGPDLEFAWVEDIELDAKTQADIDVERTKVGHMSINEVRDTLGLDPVEGGDEPMVVTATGFVPLDSFAQQQAMQQQQAEQARQDAQAARQQGNGAEPGSQASPGVTGGQKTPPGGDKPGAASKPGLTVVKSAYTRLGKAVRHEPIPFPAAAKKAVRTLADLVAGVLAKAGEQAAHEVSQLFPTFGKDNEPETDEAKAKRIAGELALTGLAGLIDVVPPELVVVMKAASVSAIEALDMSAAVEFDRVFERAVDYSKERAAEMVGKRRDASGNLVDNPEADWRIDVATRDELRSIIAKGLADNVGHDEIQRRIQAAGAFSPARARLIADAEITRANSLGALEGYRAIKATGVDVKKAWDADAEPCPVCVANAAQGPIELNEPFASGDLAPGAHPRCRCALLPILEDD